MSKLASLLGGNLVVPLGAAAVLISGGVGVYFKDTLLGTPSVPQTAPQVEAPQEGGIREAVLQSDGTPNNEPAASAQDAAPATAPVSDPVAGDNTNPSFDIVRVAPDGGLTVAGEGEAGQDVELLLDGEVLATLTAGSDGSFAHLGILPSSDTARVLSLRSAESGAEGQSEVLIAPIVEPVDAPALAGGATSEGTPSEAVTAQLQEPETSPITPAETPAETAKAQAVVEISRTGVDVIQPTSPQVMSEVALDAISYSDAGEVQLSGRAPREGFVRVYLDNKPIITQPVANSGQWRTELPNVDTGVYTLRVDKVDASGAVTSRVETPFKREPAGKVQEAKVKAVTVQPGATLWAIAAERFGSGVLYVQLYEANKDKIRDPNLIYPGQVFDIPG